MNNQISHLKAKSSLKNILTKNFIGNFLLLLFLFLISTPLVHGNHSSKEEDKLLFEQIFNEWTKAFNQKDLAKTCALFSKNLTATYYNIPSRDGFGNQEHIKSAEHSVKNNDYDSICNGFKKILSEKDKRYQYRFEIHRVYRSVDLAAIRITWYLTVDEPGKKTALTQDEGLDILEQDADKQWKIVQFLGFGGS